VEYAEPDLVTIGRHTARPPIPRCAAPATPSPMANNDPLLNQQYAMTITKALDAWNLQGGDPSIKIAILDEGVDTNHEDLGAAVVGSYDGTDDDTFQEPNSWDGHGTACAGLAAAIPQNNRGVRGSGGGCSILAVRIAYSSAPGGNWSTSNSIIARSIDWAWRNAADVLSNSWGGGAPSSAINNAFERARTQGRTGKGCVIVVAAGNGSGPVGYPGTLPNVLTVSATNEADEFKTKTSSDGETWWGSDFGPEVDISAPGVHNYTTDIMGSAGYIAGNYTPTFNGTSSSTPIVAGAVGLILSANKSLTEDAVRKIIAQAADKVGPYPYVGGRNDRYGNGRLNVLKAIQMVKSQIDNGTSFQGTILQWGSGIIKPGAFFLQTTNGELFLLKHYVGNEPTTSQVLEKQSLNYLSQFVGANRTVTFLQRQDTPQGSILWGVNVS
jgi:subtilisin family serine protease